MNDLKEYLPVIIILFIFLHFTLSSIFQRRRLKRMDRESLVCTKCHSRGAKNPRITSLGFLKFTCTSCEKNFVLPLSTGLRVSYVLLSLLIVIYLLIALPLMYSWVNAPPPQPPKHLIVLLHAYTVGASITFPAQLDCVLHLVYVRLARMQTFQVRKPRGTTTVHMELANNVPTRRAPDRTFDVSTTTLSHGPLRGEKDYKSRHEGETY